jgi:FkbM family methyltransferase
MLQSGRAASIILKGAAWLRKIFLMMSRLLSALKARILGTPVEGLARRAYLRLDPSPGGRYDRQTLAIMRRCLGPGSNCVDIGAHRGAILREILAAAPLGQHFAFEPLPEHAAYLATAFPGVRVFPIALSDQTGKAAFTRVLAHPTRSSFKDPTGGVGIETIRVETDRLDNLLPPELKIDFIKLDVEGAEYQVLKGGVRTIRSHQPYLVFEHSQLSQENFQAPPEMVFDLLALECGLQISLLGDWLEGKPPLERARFADEVTQGKNFYFLAHRAARV